MKTSSRGALLVLVPVLLSGCVSVGSPRPGSPVQVEAGQALVFGRIRVTSPGSTRELLVFSHDPLEHVIPPDPVFNLELRKLHAPGGAVRYASHPSPGIEEDGSFHWVLAEGDYALASNPRAYGSSRFDPAETTVLARFGVPRGAGTVYLGTLEVVVELESGLPFQEGYAIVRLAVADEGDRPFAALLSRYPSVPEPRATIAMIPESQ